MDKHLIVSYEKLAQLLKLDEREIEMDMLLAESANGCIKLITDRQIIARDILDATICSDGILTVEEWPIQSINAILSSETGSPIDCTPVFETSDTSRTIHIDSKFDGKKLGIVYRGGYEVDEVPAVLVEAVIKLFFDKKANLALEAIGQADVVRQGKHIYDEIMQMVAPYIRKSL